MGELIHRFLSDINIVVTESTGELSLLFLILLLFVVIILTGFYVYNRTKNLTKLSKQIPASLVRAHLNSIIQNSKDLKDSLFLEDGKDPLAESKNDILALKEELKEKEKIISELLLQKSAPSAPVTSASTSNEEMEKIAKERDELLLRISDYEKAQEDLVNIKKLKKENEELKTKLGISTEASPEEQIKVEGAPAEEVPTEEHAKTEEASPLEAFEKAATAAEKTENEEPKIEEGLTKEEKSAEDLLKEFEKMLG